MQNTLKPEDRRNETELQHGMNLTMFVANYSVPGVEVEDWIRYFQEAWSKAGATVTASTEVNVRETKYYEELNILLKAKDKM